eukprot:1831931-Amphidinium_carterae.2
MCFPSAKAIDGQILAWHVKGMKMTVRAGRAALARKLTVDTVSQCERLQQSSVLCAVGFNAKAVFLVLLSAVARRLIRVSRKDEEQDPIVGFKCEVCSSDSAV